jgi:hypothetical protein
MAFRTNGRRGLFPRPSTTNYLYLRWPNLTTATATINPKVCDNCGELAPHLALYVARPGGGNSDNCRPCYLRLTDAERRAELRAQWDSLFRPGFICGFTACTQNAIRSGNLIDQSER